MTLPVASPAYFLAEDTTLAISAALGVLKNDADVDIDALAALLVEGVHNGHLRPSA